MTAWLEVLTVLIAACFAGGSLYVSLVEHPARVAAGLPVAMAQFATSYPRAAVWQGSLAALGSACGLLAFAANGDGVWAGGALALGAVIPWTLALMIPINRELTRARSEDVARAERLFARWARLHAVRSVLGTAALVAFVARLAG